MNDDCQAVVPPELKGRRYTAVDLLKMPRDQRHAILEEVAILAEPLDRNDPDLTAFQCFGPDDLYGESSSSETL